jgi:hypothetical protein
MMRTPARVVCVRGHEGTTHGCAQVCSWAGGRGAAFLEKRLAPGDVLNITIQNGVRASRAFVGCRRIILPTRKDRGAKACTRERRRRLASSRRADAGVLRLAPRGDGQARGLWGLGRRQQHFGLRAAAEAEEEDPARHAAATAGAYRRHAHTCCRHQCLQCPPGQPGYPWRNSRLLSLCATQAFTALSDDLELSEGGAMVTRGGRAAGSSPTSLKGGRKLGGGGRPGAGNRYRMAMCADEIDLILKGRHHLVEFELTKAAGNATIGVAQPNYDPLKVYLPGEPRGEAGESWGMSTRSGSLSFRGQVNSWPGRRPAAEGDRIGMLVDLKVGSLTVFLNQVKLGTMVATGLEGPLCWMAELSTTGDAVRIAKVDPLPAWAC